MPPEIITQQAAELTPFFEEHEVPEESREMFAYYLMQAPEGARPEWTWHRFDRGIAPYGSYHSDDTAQNYDLDKVDFYGKLLIPNYEKRTDGITAVLDATKPLAEDMAEVLERGSLLVVSNHPTIVTPMLTARSVVEALRKGIPDIQERLYITYGVLPTVFEYNFGELGTVSPVGMATAVGNTALTAAVSDSNIQPTLKKAQEPLRNWYKGNVADLLSHPGNIVVVVPNGQRDVRFSSFNPKARKIHHPEGDLEVFEQPGAHMVNIAVFDHLLEDPNKIGSPVQMYPDTRIRRVTKRLLSEANVFQANVLNPTFDGSPYYAERPRAMDMRLGDRARMLKDFAEGKVRGILDQEH